MATNLRDILEQLLGAGTAPGGARPGEAGADPGPRGGPSHGGPLGGMFGGASPFGASFGGSFNDMLGRIRPPATGGQAAAAGGLLGAVLGGGLARTGGMALLGYLAHRAYSRWQEEQAGATRPAPEGEFAQPEAADSQGRPFGLSLIRAMVAAARADGALDAAERERIFAEAERLDLSAEDKGEIFAILDTPADPRAIAALAATEPQKAELYLASAMAMGASGSGRSGVERAWLDALAGALGLPTELRAKLDSQLRETGSGAAPA